MEVQNKANEIISYLSEHLPEEYRPTIQLIRDNLRLELTKSPFEQLKYFIQGYCNSVNENYQFQAVYCNLATILITDITTRKCSETSGNVSKDINESYCCERLFGGLPEIKIIAIAFKMLSENVINIEDTCLFVNVFYKYIAMTFNFIDKRKLLQNILS